MTRPPFLRPGALAHLSAAGSLAWQSLRHLGKAAWLALGHLLAAVVALIVVFEEWGWRPLANLLARLGRLRPFAILEGLIRGLRPYPALAVFALPSLLILPLKLVALYLIASGHALAAGALFIAAKVVGTALVARLYTLTEPALMQLPWFKRGYDVLMPYKTALTDWVHTSAVWRYARLVKRRVALAIAPLKARAAAAILRLRARLLR